MATPNPTLYVMLHKGQNEITAYVDTNYTPADKHHPIHASPGGQINVMFVNKQGNPVETGLVSFIPKNGTASPFNPQEPTVNNNDNGSGTGTTPISATSPAQIASSAEPGSYEFCVVGFWDNSKHHSSSDPIVVIDQ